MNLGKAAKLALAATTPENIGVQRKRTAWDVINSPEWIAKMKEIKKQMNAGRVTKTSNNLYHTTSVDNLKSISERGLVVGEKQRHEGVASPNKLSFSANEKGAKYYAGANDIMLRTKRGFKPDDLDYDLLAGGEGYYRTGTNIPPSLLEAKVNSKWVDLSLLKLGAGGLAAGTTLSQAKDALAQKYKKMESDQALQDAYSPVDMIIAGATGGATMGLRAISALADPVINYAIDRMLGD